LPEQAEVARGTRSGDRCPVSVAALDRAPEKTPSHNINLWVRIVELNVTRCYDERVIAETMGEVEQMSVLSLEHQRSCRLFVRS
jgi:hypothetical protein